MQFQSSFGLVSFPVFPFSTAGFLWVTWVPGVPTWGSSIFVEVLWGGIVTFLRVEIIMVFRDFLQVSCENSLYAMIFFIMT